MIFTRAKVTIVWFNDVESWKGVQAAVRQFCIEEMRGLGKPIPDGVTGILSTEHDIPLELYRYQENWPPRYRTRLLPDVTTIWETHPSFVSAEVQAESSETILANLVDDELKRLMHEI
jgi:hypothetical protein